MSTPFPRCIMITNDDGPPSPFAPYLLPFTRELQQQLNAAAAVTKVYVCTPAHQQSWSGKSITRFGSVHCAKNWGDAADVARKLALAARPKTGEQANVQLWATVDATPATVTNIGLHTLNPFLPSSFSSSAAATNSSDSNSGSDDTGIGVDLVISGPNYGRNCGHRFMFSSGTVAAAMEATFAAGGGVRAIAVSFAYGSKTDTITDAQIADACKLAVKTILQLWCAWPSEQGGIRLFNLNVPLVMAERKATVLAHALTDEHVSSYYFPTTPTTTTAAATAPVTTATPTAITTSAAVTIAAATAAEEDKPHTAAESFHAPSPTAASSEVSESAAAAAATAAPTAAAAAATTTETEPPLLPPTLSPLYPSHTLHFRFDFRFDSSSAVSRCRNFYGSDLHAMQQGYAAITPLLHTVDAVSTVQQCEKMKQEIEKLERLFPRLGSIQLQMEKEETATSAASSSSSGSDGAASSSSSSVTVATTAAFPSTDATTTSAAPTAAPPTAGDGDSLHHFTSAICYLPVCLSGGTWSSPAYTPSTYTLPPRCCALTPALLSLLSATPYTLARWCDPDTLTDASEAQWARTYVSPIVGKMNVPSSTAAAACAADDANRVYSSIYSGYKRLSAELAQTEPQLSACIDENTTELAQVCANVLATMMTLLLPQRGAGKHTEPALLTTADLAAAAQRCDSVCVVSIRQQMRELIRRFCLLTGVERAAPASLTSRPAGTDVLRFTILSDLSLCADESLYATVRETLAENMQKNARALAQAGVQEKGEQCVQLQCAREFPVRSPSYTDPNAQWWLSLLLEEGIAAAQSRLQKIIGSTTVGAEVLRQYAADFQQLLQTLKQQRQDRLKQYISDADTSEVMGPMQYAVFDIHVFDDATGKLWVLRCDVSFASSHPSLFEGVIYSHDDSRTPTAPTTGAVLMSARLVAEDEDDDEFSRRVVSITPVNEMDADTARKIARIIQLLTTGAEPQAELHRIEAKA